MTINMSMLKRIVKVRNGEVRALLWSFGYFFCLLCSYYVVRPVRDEMGIQGGIDQLQWVFTGTFIAMLVAVPIYGWVVARFPRRILFPLVYTFFIFNILLFALLFHNKIAPVITARSFFIWVSVFNLFVVSVFWSFMADLFSNEQARRLFGFIAAGGSTGAVAGPILTAGLATQLGTANLLLASAILLALAMVCIHRLLHWATPSAASTTQPDSTPTLTDESPSIGGSVWAGIKLLARSPYLLGIGLFIVLYTTLSTFLYFEQAHIVKAAFDDSGKRMALFAAIDLGVNILTIGGQVFLTAHLVARLGLATTLALLPTVMAIGFLVLGVFPLLAILVGFQVLRRAGNYAIARPAREMLFTVVTREEKYKAKNVIDTVVYRGGDAVSAWVFAGLSALGLSLSAIAFIAIPIALAWLATGVGLGRRQETLRMSENTRKTVVTGDS